MYESDLIALYNTKKSVLAGLPLDWSMKTAVLLLDPAAVISRDEITQEITYTSSVVTDTDVVYAMTALKQMLGFRKLVNVRNNLLKNLDVPWGLADYESSKLAAVRAYRQQLRDLPYTVIANIGISAVDGDNLSQYLPTSPLA